jgi:hypothetical protein
VATRRGRRRKSTGAHELSTADRNELPDRTFAFPKERKEPLNDASHVRNAIARFDQVEGVTDAERTEAWKRIKAAAKKFDVHVEAERWQDLFADNGTKRTNRTKRD